MKPQTMAAIVLIVVGACGLAYGGFNYTKDSHSMKLGSMTMSLDEREHLNIPLWVSISLIVGGVIMLSLRKKG